MTLRLYRVFAVPVLSLLWSCSSSGSGGVTSAAGSGGAAVSASVGSSGTSGGGVVGSGGGGAGGGGTGSGGTAGGGTSGTGGSGTGGGGTGGAGGGIVVLSGAIVAAPIVVSDPAIDPASPSLIAVYWSDDGGSTWYSEYTRCAVVLGSPKLSRSFLVSKGKLVLTQSYCTAGATNYQVVIESGATLLQGPFSAPMKITSPLFTTQSLPKLSVMWSEDGGTTWYAEYTLCAVALGSSTLTRTFAVKDGELDLPQSYCTEGSTHYRIAVKPNAAHLGGPALPRPANVPVAGLTTSALGFLSVYWSEDGGTSWYSEYTRCAVASGSASLSRSFLLSNGQLTLSQSYCTEKGALYQLAE